MKKTNKNKDTRISQAAFERKTGAQFCKKHTAKMRGVKSISTSCLKSDLCKARKDIPGMICAHCYSMSMHEQYADLARVLSNNTDILTTVLFDAETMPKLSSPSGYFRFEAFGDLINEIQVANYFHMAAANPQMHCALWTKNPWIIRSAIKMYDLEKPGNLTIIGSSYYENQQMDFVAYPFIDKMFTVYTPEYAREHDIEINCGARSCATCGRCYENKGGRYVNELLK